VLRLNRLINKLNTADEVKHTLKIFKLIFFMILYIHFVACAWFYACNITEKWKPVGFIKHDKRRLKGSVVTGGSDGPAWYKEYGDTLYDMEWFD
jgi:hypothetical protein